MKRPQGFGQPPAASAPANSVKPAKSIKEANPAKPGRVTPIEAKVRAPQASAPKRLREAKRERRKVEKDEVRRFTRRTRLRRRRVLAGVAIGTVFAAVIGVLTWSPLLALEDITIVGTSRVDAVAVRAALDDQIGTPLALVNLDEVTTALSAFPLIRSYSTQSLPPHSLVVTIVEREPIGAVDDGTRFAVVDAAGVVIESVEERPLDVPLLDVGDPDPASPAFASAVEVLLALEPGLRARVESLSATTEDDVTLFLAGGAQSVQWGSATRSTFKARVLAALIASQPPTARIEFDVSAPDAPVVRAR